MLVSLTKPASKLTLTFLEKALQPTDILMASSSAIHLALTECPLNITAYIRVADANKLGGIIHTSWTAIDDSQWLSLIQQHNKSVTW